MKCPSDGVRDQRSLQFQLSGIGQVLPGAPAARGACGGAEVAASRVSPVWRRREHRHDPARGLVPVARTRELNPYEFTGNRKGYGDADRPEHAFAVTAGGDGVYADIDNFW